LQEEKKMIKVLKLRNRLEETTYPMEVDNDRKLKLITF